MNEPIVTREMEAAGEAVIENLYGAVGAAYLARCVYIAMADLSPHEYPDECAVEAAGSQSHKSQK